MTRTTAPSEALRGSREHPGYDHRLSPGINYRKGIEFWTVSPHRLARREGLRKVVEEMNDLYVLDKNRARAAARVWKATERIASEELKKSRLG